MEEAGQSNTAVFLGDLSDAWVAAIAESLPPSTIRIDHDGELADQWPSGITEGAALFLQRAILTGWDAERIRRARRSGLFARVVLIVGPHSRYEAVQRWSALVDAILPEATASEVISRHLNAPPSPAQPAQRGSSLRVISSNHELRAALTDACALAGYKAVAIRDWSDAPTGIPCVWDVPVLEPDWQSMLASQTGNRPVVALIGFANRELVSSARRQGAAACLDLPCDPADLVFVLDRLTAASGRARRLDPGHDGSLRTPTRTFDRSRSMVARDTPP